MLAIELAPSLVTRPVQAVGGQASSLTAADRENQLLFIYQIPLVQHRPARFSDDIGGVRDCVIMPSMKPQGPWLGLEQVKLERDMRGPIRLTAQIYKVSAC